jgi:membrane fusion protein, multidrug efflux system
MFFWWDNRRFQQLQQEIQDMTMRRLTITCITILMLSTACGEEEAPNAGGPGARGGRGGGFSGMEAVPVKVDPVETGAISSYILKPTNLEAEREVIILARQQGQMTSLVVEEGDRVRRNQTLAIIDQREYQLAVDDAKAKLVKARLDYERNQKLFEEKMIAEQIVESSKSAYESAKATLERNEINLAYATVRAPFSGVVTHRTCEIGMTVRQNVELFRMIDDTPIRARIHVPEKEMGRLAEGQRARIRIETKPDNEYQGIVQLISPVVDPLSGTIKVTVEINEHGGDLRPGMFAEVYIITETRENSRIIPKRALLLETEEDMVFIYNDGVAKRTPVEIGFVDGDRVEILAGLADGQQIITVGQEGLRDGANVRIPAEGETVGTAPQQTAAAGGEGGGGRRGGMNLSPEDQEKIANMSQEERRAFMMARRAQAEAEGGAVAAPVAAAPMAVPQRSDGEAGGRQGRPQAQQQQASSDGADGGRAGGGRRGGMMNLSPEDQAKVENMSQDERRAFFQARRAQADGGGAPAGGAPAGNAAAPAGGERQQTEGGRAGGGRRGGMNLSPEDQAKVENMSQDERRAFMMARRAQTETEGGAAAAAPTARQQAAGSADNSRIDRALSNLIAMSPEIKTEYDRRMAADPDLKTNSDKKAAFLREMITKMQNAQ